MSGAGAVRFSPSQAKALLKKVIAGYGSAAQSSVYCSCGSIAHARAVVLRSDLWVGEHPLAAPYASRLPPRLRKDPNPETTYRFHVAACREKCGAPLVVYHHENGIPSFLRDAVEALGGRVVEVTKGAPFRAAQQLKNGL